MNYQTRLLLFILMTISNPITAFGKPAGFVAEPFVGFRHLGDINVNKGLDRKGSNFGIRLGHSLSHEVGMGFDYRLGKIAMDLISGGQNDFSTNRYGLYCSYTNRNINEWDFRITWFINASEKNKSNKHVLKGNGFSLGAGFKLISYFSINIEFSHYNFDEIENSNGDVSSAQATFGADKLTGSDFFLGFSFPIFFSKLWESNQTEANITTGKRPK